MRKLYLFLIIGILCLGVAGCGGSQTTAKESGEVVTTTNVSTESEQVSGSTEEATPEATQELEPTLTPEATPEPEKALSKDFEQLPDGIYFRDSVWGMTIDDIRIVEKSKLVEESEIALAYSGQVNYLDTYIYYKFNSNDELFNGGYSITAKHSEGQLYINDYNSIDTILTEKYGEPTKYDEIWYDSFYKDTPEKYGSAFSLGHLAYKTEWEKDGVTIIHGIISDNRQIMHMIDYKHLELAKDAVEEDSGL